MADTKAQIVISAVNRSQAAFAQVKGQFDSLQAASAGLLARFGSLGAAVTGAFAGISLAGAIKTLDDLDDLSEKSGIAVEALSGLRFAGEVVGTSFDDLATGTSKLAKNMAAAAGGSKEAQAAFDAIGVSVKNTDGTLRSTEQVLLDVADRFAGYKDGAGKAALAQAIFGKSGETLIPILNQGRIGIERLSKEAAQLGVVYSGDVAKSAAEFNDQLRKIAFSSEAVKTRLAAEVLPALNATASAFLENAKNSNLFVAALKTIGGGIAARLGFDEQGRLEAGAAVTSASIARVVSQIEEFQDALAKNPGNRAYAQRIQELRAEFLALQSDAQKTTARLAQLANGGSSLVDPNDANDALSRRLGRGDAKGDAPVINRDTNAAAERDRQLRIQLQGRLQLIEDGLKAQTEAFQYGERSLQQAYDAGNVSLADFYAERQRITQVALQQQLDAIDARVAAERQFAAATPEKNSRAEAENRINDLLRQRIGVQSKAAQETVLASAEESRAIRQLQGQLVDLNAQVLELGGNDKAAALARLEQQLVGVSAILRQAGQDDGIAERLRELGRASIELTAIRREETQITERAALAEEALLLEAERSGRGRLETEREIFAQRVASLEQLRQLAQRASELAAANPGNADFELQAQRLQNSVLVAEQNINPALQRIQERSAAIADSFGDAVNEFLRTGNASDALKNLGQQLESIFFQIVIIEPLVKSLRTALEGLGKSGGAGGSGAGGILGGLFSAFLASAKGNAFVPQGAVQAFAKGSAFANQIISEPTLFKFARGSRLGLMGEAGPEAVLPLKRAAGGGLGVQLAGGGGQTVNYSPTFVLEQPASRDTQQQVATAAFQGGRRAFGRNG